MKSLSINFWSQCSNNCLFCFCREKDLLAEKVGAPVIDSLIDLSRALRRHRASCDWLIISGNEPTLNPNLLKAILLAKKNGYGAEIRTNGRALKDRKFCLKLIKAGLDSIGITLLSHQAKTHDFLTRTSNSFKETVQGIKNFIALGNASRLAIYIVINRFNFRHLVKIVSFCHKLGVKNLQLNFVYHNDKEIVPQFSEVVKPLNKALTLATGLGLNIGTYGLPPCFLGEYQKLAIELGLKNEVILGGRISDYNYLRTNLGKRKTKYCRQCLQKNTCEGTWKSYYNVYGEEEFKNRPAKIKANVR